MNKSSLSKFSLFISAILLNFSVSTYALEANDTNTHKIIIPVIDNAQVFSNFTDELPAVLNYFTNATKSQVSDFYHQHYGNVLSQQKKHNSLTQIYKQENHRIRVIISQQNKKRQVDIIVELTEE